jgi:hypothetical protein
MNSNLLNKPNSKKIIQGGGVLRKTLATHKNFSKNEKNSNNKKKNSSLKNH